MQVTIGFVQVHLQDHNMVVWVLELNSGNAMDESPHSETIVAME